MKLYLIRHARSIANEMEAYSGATDVSLSANGISELEKFKKEGIYPNAEDIDCFYTSTLKRTKQTFEIIYPNIKYKSIYQLREVDFGIYEIKNFEEVKHYKHYLEWNARERFTMFDTPEGENEKDFYDRIKEGLYQILTEMNEHSYKNSALVIHGAVMSILMESLYKHKEGYYSWLPDNGRGYMLEFQDSDIQNIKCLDDIDSLKAINYKDI